MRAMGKDFLRLRLDPTAKSYWIDRTPPGPPPQSMKKPILILKGPTSMGSIIVELWPSCGSARSSGCCRS